MKEKQSTEKVCEDSESNLEIELPGSLSWSLKERQNKGPCSSYNPNTDTAVELYSADVKMRGYGF